MGKRVGRGVAQLAGVGLAAGVVAAGIWALPVGGAGVAIMAATDELQPVELKEPPLAEKSTLLDAAGKPIAQFYEVYREIVPLTDVAETMKTAIIAIEDFRFYEHGPIDFQGMARALAKNLSAGGVSEGGSTITQQYVKQVLLTTARTKEEKAKALETSYARKLNELRYAMSVEEKYTKDQILEKYLNIAYFGAGANGVEAAAKRFFGVPAAKLTLGQAATLAGAVQSPSNTDPSVSKAHRARLLERRNIVLDRMADLGRISKEDAAAAKAKKLGYKGVPLPGGCESSSYAYFCLYARNEILNDPAFGKTRTARKQLLERGGLTIRTTLDRRMQTAADRAIKKRVFTTDNPVAAEALVQPGTGKIKAMAASREYGSGKDQMSYNLVADVAHGGGTGFQPGSTFKTFTLVAALQQGMRVNDGMTVGAGYRAPGYASFKNCKGGNAGDPTHTVTNDEGSGGYKTLQTGTWGSVNTFFLELEQRVGLCETVKTAKALGSKRADGKPLGEVQTFTLGVNESDPVTVAASYAALGARGKYCEPMAITAITDRDGKKTDYEPKCRQAIDPEVADATAHVLSGVFTKGTMRGVGGIGRPAAGKTGTTDDYAAAWFAGFTPDLAAAVSIGDLRGAQRYKLTGVTIGGRYYGLVAGATISGPIWQETMMAALKGVPQTPFTPLNTARFGGGEPPPSQDEPTNDDETPDEEGPLRDNEEPLQDDERPRQNDETPLPDEEEDGPQR